MLLSDCSTEFMKQVLPRFLSPTTRFVAADLARFAGVEFSLTAAGGVAAVCSTTDGEEEEEADEFS